MLQTATQEGLNLHAPLELEPPEIVTPVVPAQVEGKVQLEAGVKAKLDEQLDTFVQGLLKANVTSDAFRKEIDKAFSIGRKEIADATTQTNAFTKQNFVGETDTPAYQAIAQMRQLFDDLNPSKQGDLFASATVLGMPLPTKILGMPVPGANRLKSYLRRYESATTQMSALSEAIAKGQTQMEQSVSELATVRQRLWDGLEKLERVVYFITSLDSRVTQEIENIKRSQPERAQALEQEVLFYIRQNVGDVRASQALVINAYQIAGGLRKTGRQTINGCDRLNTLGMAALSIGVTLAKATGLEIRMHKMLTSANKSVEDLIVSTGEAFAKHVDASIEFSSNPLLGVEKLQQMFDTTNAAVTKLETYRSERLAAQAANNAMLGGMVEKELVKIGNDRKAMAIADGIAL